jgi:hypothetical protein
METAVTTYQPSEDAIISNSLMNIENTFIDAARTQFFSQTNGGEGYTGAEQNAIVLTEALRLVRSLDLTAIMLRDKMLKEIEDTGAWSEHPERFQGLQALAQYVGLSITQLSYEGTVCRVVFPYFATLGITPVEIFDRISRSNLNEIVPVLRIMITGEQSARPATNEAATRFLDNAAASLRTAGENPTPNDIRDQAVQDLFENGATMTQQAIRRHIRPSRTAPMDPVVITRGGRRYVIAAMDEDQYEALKNKTGTFLGDVNYIEDYNPNQARQVPGLRDLI